MTENLHAVNAVDFPHEGTAAEREAALSFARAAMLMPEDAEFADLIYSPPGSTVTLTIEPDLRRLRAAFARASGKQHLADVIMEQPGRRIVRDGMADVLHWLKECACTDDGDHLCDYAAARLRENFEDAARLTGLAMAAIERTFRDLVEHVKTSVAALDDFVLAPPPPTGRAAQRSPYGPQKRR